MPRTGVDLPEEIKIEARKAALEDKMPFYAWIVQAIREKLERRKNQNQESGKDGGE